MKKAVKWGLSHLGYEVWRVRDRYFDVDKDFFEIYEKCKDYTKTPFDRLYALYKSTEYICSKEIVGDFAECGVYFGGSVMCMAYSLARFGQTNRHLYLYDTFEGMTDPTEKDIQAKTDIPAKKLLSGPNRTKHLSYASIDAVRKNMRRTNYPESKMSFVRGRVEDTIPDVGAEKIALLRLDTDWYESTKHELVHLYPRLTVGGVLIIDDYGSYKGAREAVDEYFSSKNRCILLNRVDFACRIGVKIK